MSREALEAWLAVLDKRSYYEVLNVEEKADPEAIKEAFHRFAEAFHPDAHAMAPPEEQRAAHTIFMRGAEAYRVLTDPALRPVYDNALAHGIVRPKSLSSMRPPPPPAREDALKIDEVAPSARSFAQRADELAHAGDFAQAKLYVNLALFHDPKSATLLAFQRWIAGRAPSKPPSKPPR